MPIVTPESVQVLLGKFVDFILRYAVTLAAVSAVSMALIEMVKALVSWRDRFQKRVVAEWIRGVAMPPILSDVAPDGPPTATDFHSLVYSALIRLTTAESVDPSAINRGVEWTP